MVFLLTLACRVPPPKNVETRKLALGAEVTWAVSNDCDARVLCVKEGASSVDGVVADASDVIDVRQVSGTTFTLRAAKVGVSRVVVQYRDATGTQRTATAWFEVKELTRSTVTVRCEQGPAVRRVFAVAPGASFEFTAQGFGGDDELDTGALPLFEANGFTLAQTGSLGRATAPMAVGSYPWTLVGGGTLDVRVYDAATSNVSLKVEAQRSDPRPMLLIELLAGEDPVCVAGPAFPATLSVTSGACFPSVSGVALRGAVPIEVGRVRTAVELEGDAQPCTVSVRLPDGRVTSVMASLPRVGVGAVGTPSGPVLDPTGVEVGLVQAGGGVVCTDGLSDGRCSHIYDGDCYVDSDWVIEHAAVAVGDAGTVLNERDVVGVGLRTIVRLRVIIDVPILPDIIVGPPKNLTFRNNHLFVLPGRAAVLDHRCPAPGTDKWHSLSVTPEASGSHHFEFRADNLNDVGRLSFDAADVTRVTWRLQDEDRRVSTASTTEAFVRTLLVPTAGYEGAGGRVLRGEGPLRFSADSPDGGRVHRSRAPRGERLVTARGPGRHRPRARRDGPHGHRQLRRADGEGGLGRVRGALRAARGDGAAGAGQGAGRAGARGAGRRAEAGPDDARRRGVLRGRDAGHGDARGELGSGDAHPRVAGGALSISPPT
jgi:hypothetical protein